MVSGPQAIEAEGLVKSFGNHRAVDEMSLQVCRGTVFGLLGPNGAGKTTLVRLLCTLLPPDAGSARVLGHDVVRQAGEVRRRIGLTGQFASVDEDLTGYENLLFLGRLMGLSRRRARERAAELLASFGLEEAAGREVRTYSGGMRRRLDIAASLLRVPELLFLDEPTTGLDPRSRNHVWELVRELVGEGTTVLLTTQYLEEADHLADRIAVIANGRLVAEGTSGELKAAVGRHVLHLRVEEGARRAEALRLLAHLPGGQVQPGDDSHSLVVKLDAATQAMEALALLHRAKIALASFSLGQPSLDEVFFTLTGGDAPEATGSRP